MFVFGIAVLLAALAFAALLYVKWRLDPPPTEDEFETSIDREVAKLLDRSDTQRIAVAVYKKGAVFFKATVQPAANRSPRPMPRPFFNSDR